MKILIAVDGSSYALDAVRFVIDHAHWYRQEPTIELVSVVYPILHLMNLSLVIDTANVERYYDDEGETALAEAKQVLDHSRLQYTAHTVVGYAHEAIVNHAVTTHCDLIVLATRGMGAIKTLLLGSTATKVLQISALPVLLVK